MQPGDAFPHLPAFGLLLFLSWICDLICKLGCTNVYPYFVSLGSYECWEMLSCGVMDLYR